MLDARGRVTALRDRGGPIPSGGEVLAGTGGAAGWLDDHARVGRTLRFRDRLTAGGRRLRLTRRLDAVNGGPRLLRAGRPAIDAEAEGFDHPDDPGFYWTFGVRRNPRTMAGVGPGGRGCSSPPTATSPPKASGSRSSEEARVLRALGARDALNLDGGGSTTMTIGGALANQPSDATGERPVGDAVLVSPR